MHNDTITAYLGELVERPAAPACGATAALNAVQAAALLAISARYCDGPAHAAHAETVGEALAEADRGVRDDDRPGLERQAVRQRLRDAL